MADIWTADQVASLKAYQVCGYWHPFTCGHGHNLVATPDGWICPPCAKAGREYSQQWAHGFMLDWSWRENVPTGPFSARTAEVTPTEPWQGVPVVFESDGRECDPDQR